MGIVVEEMAADNADTAPALLTPDSDVALGLVVEEATFDVNNGAVASSNPVSYVESAQLAVKDASTYLDSIAPGPSNRMDRLLPVNEAVLSSIVSQNGTWTILTKRLATLLGVADQIAEVGHSRSLISISQS